MSGRKLLIDTNVFIGLEDEREVAPESATLQQLCAHHSVRIFIHERAADDIGETAMQSAVPSPSVRFGSLNS
jgi:hypothetical protein